MNEVPLSLSGKPTLDIVLESVRAVGAMVRSRFYTAKQVANKSDTSLVTDVDIQSEQQIRDALTQEFPGIGVLGEEMGLIGSGGMRWIVDPIDGTRNFAAGVPHFALSIALADEDDVLLGVTYDPMRNEMFHAVQGEGAFLNGAPITVSQHTSVAQAILGFDIGGMDIRALHTLNMVEDLWPGMQSVRVLGSATLGMAYAATGRLGVYFHHTLAPWDVAAGLLLVREAGGKVVDRRTRQSANIQSTGIVAASSALLAEFLEITKEQAWYTTP